jgi:hypothetical protein
MDFIIILENRAISIFEDKACKVTAREGKKSMADLSVCQPIFFKEIITQRKSNLFVLKLLIRSKLLEG